VTLGSRAPDSVLGPAHDAAAAGNSARAPAALSVDEGFFRSLVENALDIILVIDPDGIIRYITPSVDAVLACAPDEIIGRAAAELVHPEDVAHASEAFAGDVLRPGGSRSIELRLRHKNGEWRVFEVAGKKPATQAGLPVLIVNCRDVTDRRETEIELRVNQRYLEQLFESAPEGIVLLDNDDRVIRVNSEFTRIFGYTLAEIRGRCVNSLIVPPHLCDEADEITRSVARGDTVNVETVRRRSDGSLIHVSILGCPIRMGDGQIAVYGIYRDISNRKQLEQQHLELLAREREARAEAEAAERRSAFLAEVSTLLDASLDYTTTFRNLARLAVPALADYCLIDEVEEGRNEVRRVALAHADPAREALLYSDARHPLDDEDPSRHPVVSVLRSGQSLLVPEITDVMLDAISHNADHRARLRALSLKSFIIVPLIARGRTLGAITLAAAENGRRYTTADVAMAEELAHRAGLAIDNARLYSRAQQAIQAREKVLAFVSHDLRNPLATILLSASAILDTLTPDQLSPWLTEQMQWIERSTDQMNRLIEDLLDVTRIEAGHLAIERYPVSAGRLIADVVEMLRPLAAERSVHLEGDTTLRQHVVADRERILQVFSNLVGNAIKFTPRGGAVRLHAEAGEGEVRFGVTDTGIGISPEHVPYLFDRYWQARRTTRGGTGLGLAIARGIVEAHEGRIWVESEVGEGSTFFFTLPLADAATQAQYGTP
jgi:PAS domain S-box-containing protein